MPTYFVPYQVLEILIEVHGEAWIMVADQVYQPLIASLVGEWKLPSRHLIDYNSQGEIVN